MCLLPCLDLFCDEGWISIHGLVQFQRHREQHHLGKWQCHVGFGIPRNKIHIIVITINSYLFIFILLLKLKFVFIYLYFICIFVRRHMECKTNFLLQTKKKLTLLASKILYCREKSNFFLKNVQNLHFVFQKIIVLKGVLKKQK